MDTEYEVILANSAREKKCAGAIDAVIDEFRNRNCGVFRLVREPLAGKCCAQNLGVRHANGAIHAFFDDDVIVTPGWLSVAAQFFRGNPHDAMQGPILVSPEMSNDWVFYKFRTINFVKYSRV
jgi:Glycosyl transferase family 2